MRYMVKPFVRQTSSSDMATVPKLQAEVYPQMDTWQINEFLKQIEVFPNGQQVTTARTFHTRNPNGMTIDGAGVPVDPRLLDKRVGHALHEGRRPVRRRPKLRRIIARDGQPNDHLYRDRMTPELYVNKVLWRGLAEPILNFQLREGFRYYRVMHGCVPDHVESGGNATLIVWLNPDFDPAVGNRLPGRSETQP